MSEFVVALALGLAMNLIVMTATWWASVKLDNYSLVDAIWSLSFSAQVIFFAVTLDGWESRRILIALLVSIWSLRLGLFLARRISRHHPSEDPRYQDLRKDYGANLKMRFLMFFLLQGLSISILTIPFILISQNNREGFHLLEITGAVLWAIAIFGEALADHQKSKFRADPANKGKVGEVGLWKYSRHPNYFFESLVWWSYFLIACAAPWGWTTIFAPLIMLFLLLNVTGVPLSEKNSLESRGEAYREYQRRVSAFIPWFRRG